ncbi:hypothetical protein CL614_00710 [archaeon]|nr:hypothetical protein [archaeon]|tara:strand:- start:625 stop:837 length:213 start_codon:yes stop_codon:yes gene_type:complete
MNGDKKVIKVKVVPSMPPQVVEVKKVDQGTADYNALCWFVFQMELLGYHLVGFIPGQDQSNNKDGPQQMI